MARRVGLVRRGARPAAPLTSRAWDPSPMLRLALLLP